MISFREIKSQEVNIVLSKLFDSLTYKPLDWCNDGKKRNLKKIQNDKTHLLIYPNSSLLKAIKMTWPIIYPKFSNLI